LHAEALGLLLAAQVANLLQIQQAIFFTDNLTLARAASTIKVTGLHIP
jgi:hypothetical protein